LHNETDIHDSGPLLTSRAADFKLSSDIIDVLRRKVIGDTFRPGAQKYAFAAAALEKIKENEFSKSVLSVKDLLGKSVSVQIECNEMFSH
jgi:hypothetical protein